MAGRAKWADIRNEGLSPESREIVDRKRDEMRLEMTLRELREKVAGLTQVELAEVLQVTQAAVSKAESRGDMHLSSLADYVKAMGGELELVATFQNQKILISQFDAVREQLLACRKAERAGVVVEEEKEEDADNALVK